MKARFRTLAALLALFAFSASFAEGLWASTCGPMGAMDSMDGSAAPAHAGAADGHMEMDPSREESPAPAPSCPLTPIVGGCAAVFSPASHASAAFVPTVRSCATAASDPAPDLLLVFSLLRPPRA